MKSSFAVDSAFKVNGSVEINNQIDNDAPVWQCLDTLGHLNVDAVLFSENRDTILVEVCPLIEEVFILKDTKSKQVRSEGAKSSQDSKENTSASNS